MHVIKTVMFTLPPVLAHSKDAIFRNQIRAGKRFLDSRFRDVVNRRASGLVRFSYKLSIFQIGGLVICRPEATRV
jgi:hypothetical protein